MAYLTKPWLTRLGGRIAKLINVYRIARSWSMTCSKGGLFLLSGLLTRLTRSPLSVANSATSQDIAQKIALSAKSLEQTGKMAGLIPGVGVIPGVLRGKTTGVEDSTRAMAHQDRRARPQKTDPAGLRDICGRPPPFLNCNKQWWCNWRYLTKYWKYINRIISWWTFLIICC